MDPESLVFHLALDFPRRRSGPGIIPAEIAACFCGSLTSGTTALEVLGSNRPHQSLYILIDVFFGGSGDFDSTEFCIASNFPNGDTRPAREAIPELGENFLLVFCISRPGDGKLLVRRGTSVRSQWTRILGLLGILSVVTGFLTPFLSVDYITEHFRFIMTNGSVPTVGFPWYFYFIDGCYTDTGQSFIQWGVPICQGKVRYVGPSREWRVLVSEANAKALMEAAGCDASNMQLTWDSDGSSIPGVTECLGMLGYHPAWQAGGQSVAPVGLPPGSYCQAATCMVHAETGAISSSPQHCAAPG
jgi:hypothetical protein